MGRSAASKGHFPGHIVKVTGAVTVVPPAITACKLPVGTGVTFTIAEVLAPTRYTVQGADR